VIVLILSKALLKVGGGKSTLQLTRVQVLVFVQVALMCGGLVSEVLTALDSNTYCLAL